MWYNMKSRKFWILAYKNAVMKSRNKLKIIFIAGKLILEILLTNLIKKNVLWTN